MSWAGKILRVNLTDGTTAPYSGCSCNACVEGAATLRAVLADPVQRQAAEGPVHDGERAVDLEAADDRRHQVVEQIAGQRAVQDDAPGVEVERQAAVARSEGSARVQVLQSEGAGGRSERQRESRESQADAAQEGVLRRGPPRPKQAAWRLVSAAPRRVSVIRATRRT